MLPNNIRTDYKIPHQRTVTTEKIPPLQPELEFEVFEQAIHE